MSAGPLGSPSRRALLALMLWGGGAAAREPDRGVDRGLGGTGAAPADPSETLGQDRGIGGTGVVGTIRRFGSIVVNDLRVAFPPGVAVTIDGRPAAAGDLRVGHVVRVLARRRAGRLVTRAIVAESEVVGPVDAVGPGRIVVLGQRVDLPEGVAVPPHGPGDRLAVSGLRRLDGVLVASLVERPPPGADRLRGTVEGNPAGAPSVGGLAISGLAPATVGRRVSLVGAREGGTFRPSEVRVEPRVPFAAADRLSLEAYVARAPDGLRLGSGLDLSARPSALAGLGEGAVRAVVLARPGPSGRLDAESLRIEARSRGSGRGADHGPDRGGVGRGPGPGGAAAPDGGHPGPGPGPRGDVGGPGAGNGPATGNGPGSASGSGPASAPGGGAGGRGNGGGRGGGPGR